MNRHRQVVHARATAGLVVALLATLTGPIPGSIPIAIAADPTPVAEWTFDEGAGTTVHDSVGALDGELGGGAAWIDEGVAEGSGALAFDGIDGVVTIPTAATLEPTGNFTVALWVRSPDIDSSAQHTILQKGFYGCEAGGSFGIAQSWHGLGGTVRLSSPWYSMWAASDDRYEHWNNQWHRVVMVVDDAADKHAIWIDGYRTPLTWPQSDQPDFGSDGRLSDALLIGNPGADCPYRKPFHGAIDDVQFYGSALSDEQVAAMMPTLQTTTTVHLSQGGEAVTTLYNDLETLFVGVIAPFPGVDGDTTWYLKADNGPEGVIGTTNISPYSMGATYLRLAPGTLAPGAYTTRAEWQGSENWMASSSPPVAFTVVKRTIDLTLAAAPADNVPGGSTTLTARAKIHDPGNSWRVPGSVDFYDTSGEADVWLGSALLSSDPQDPTWNRATWNVTDLLPGILSFEARYAGTETLRAAEASALVRIGPQGSSPYLEVGPNPVLQTAHASATVSLATFRKHGETAGGALPPATGSLTLRRTTGAVIGTAPVDGPGPYTFSLPTFPPGTVSLVAEYSGDTNFDPSTSNQVDLAVQTDIVDASGVGVDYGTFYPYKDGYRDTLTVRGTRAEPISVVIAIYSPTGTRVKLTSVPTGTGAYGYAWNGRNSAGTILASGKYKVVQTLKDAVGNKRTFTSYTTLSKKRLYYSTTYVTKNGSSISSIGDEGTGSVSLSTSSGIAKLVGKYPSGWVGVGYQFTLPSAPVYKSIAFQAYTKGVLSAPPSEIAMQNFNSCPYSSVWDVSCFDRWHGAVATTNVTSWVSTTGHPSFHRSGRTVRGLVSVPFGTLYVYKVRVKVTYGVLK